MSSITGSSIKNVSCHFFGKMIVDFSQFKSYISQLLNPTPEMRLAHEDDEEPWFSRAGVLPLSPTSETTGFCDLLRNVFESVKVQAKQEAEKRKNKEEQVEKPRRACFCELFV